jgi:hypothetical protein
MANFDKHSEWTYEVKQGKLKEVSAGLETASLDQLIAQSRGVEGSGRAMTGRIDALSIRLKALRQRLDDKFRELDSR